MSYLARMIFYVHKDTEGRIHVQNAVGPYLGQKHVHSAKDFNRWKREGSIKDSDIVWDKHVYTPEGGIVEKRRPRGRSRGVLD